VGGDERAAGQRWTPVLHAQVTLLVLPERRRQRSYPRAVKVKMSNCALNRRKRRG